MQIKDVMKKPVFLKPSATRKEILSVVKKHPNTTLFIVTDAKKRFLGEIHENNLFYMVIPDNEYDEIGVELAFDLQKKFFAKTAKEIMHKSELHCTPSDEVHSVMLEFARVEENDMPVIDAKNKVVGVVNQGNILRCLKL